MWRQWLAESIGRREWAAVLRESDDRRDQLGNASRSVRFRVSEFTYLPPAEATLHMCPCLGVSWREFAFTTH